MAKKPTKQQQIDELKDVLKMIYKKMRYGLMAQVARSDRNSTEVAQTVGTDVMEICKEHMTK